MARSLTHTHTFLSLFTKPPSASASAAPAFITGFPHRQRKPLLINCSSSNSRSSLNAPLEPTSSPGRSLIAPLLENLPEPFYLAVSSALSRLSDDRLASLAPSNLAFSSPDAHLLHRRIAKLKEEECQTSIEDIMYMIVYQKFLHIRVPLVPTLDKCLYNGRLEILPSKDGELEAIHSDEVLEMIREHLTSVLGWKVGSSVTVNWAPTTIEKMHLSQVYTASLAYGYSLKSIAIRHRLERNISESYLDIIPSEGWASIFGSGFYGIRSIALGEFSTPRSTTMSQVKHPYGKPSQKLKSYAEGLDQDTLQWCAKMRSCVTVDLAEKHCSALFVNENCGNKPILTSMASLKRLVLEAIAFGGFLWDAEEYVDRVYKLEK